MWKTCGKDFPAGEDKTVSSMQMVPHMMTIMQMEDLSTKYSLPSAAASTPLGHFMAACWKSSGHLSRGLHNSTSESFSGTLGMEKLWEGSQREVWLQKKKKMQGAPFTRQPDQSKKEVCSDVSCSQEESRKSSGKASLSPSVTDWLVISILDS